MCSVLDQAKTQIDKVALLVTVTGTYRNSSPRFDDECRLHFQAMQAL